MSTDSTLTSKGQTTVPKAIRERLRLKPGDRITFTPMPDGTVVMACGISSSDVRRPRRSISGRQDCRVSSLPEVRHCGRGAERALTMAPDQPKRGTSPFNGRSFGPQRIKRAR
jgi:AbrB family looped-hinge helix DNA binding protein